MKRLIKGLGAQLGSALVFAAFAAAQEGAEPEAAPPADAPVIAGTGGAAGGFAGAGGMAGFGGMAPPTSDIRVVNAGPGIPVGGGLLVYSGGGTNIAPIVEVADSAAPNTTLGGTLTQIAQSYYWVWVPTAPLTVDVTYNVRLSAPDLGITGLSDTFKAIAAITISKPAIASAPSASWRGETNNWACCRSLIGGILQDASCFPSEQRASVMLEPGFTTSDPAVLLNQFVFRLGSDEVSADTTFPNTWPNVVLSPMYTQREEYCFELQAIEIVSGTVMTYEDIERCAPHGELADLGVIPLEPGAAELDRVVCHAPPDQYTDEWCELNEDPCAEDDMATGCGLYGFVCEGEPLPPDPFSQMGGFSGMGGFGAVGGAGVGGMTGGAGGSGSSSGEGGASGMSDEGGEGGDDDDGMSSGGDSGCSVKRVQSSSGMSLGYALSAAALAWVARRRKRTA